MPQPAHRSPPDSLTPITTAALVVVAVAASAMPPRFGAHVHARTVTVPGWAIGAVAGPLAVAVAVLFALLLWRLRRHRAPGQRRRAQPVRPNARDALVIAAVIGALIGLVAAALLLSQGGAGQGLSGAGLSGGAGSAAPDGGRPAQTLFVVMLAAAGIILAGAVLGVWLRRAHADRPGTVARRIRRQPAASEPDSLVWSADPRAAVVQAYGVAERSLAAAGLARHSAETPREYLERVRASSGGSPALPSLTGLYEQARFGPHPIHAVMRAAAIDAAERLRAERRS